MGSSERKLGLLALTALVVGAIIGSGIFSLPQNMAEGAGAGAIIIAWVITFFGMLTLTKIFQWLSTRRSDIDDGIYGYAREGFGDYMGFNAAWGYWMSVWIGNAGYLVVMFSAIGSLGVLGVFGGQAALPIAAVANFSDLSFGRQIDTLLSSFGDGRTKPALICGLIVLWSVHAFVLKGVRSAAILNVIVTIAKVVPIALFVVCVVLAFRVQTFHMDFWGSPNLGSVSTQVKATMLYTMWVFLGIESATTYASRAKDAVTVSRATFLGFLITMVLLVCVSVLSLGVVPQHVLAQMKNPSMAAVMSYAVGPWGALVINVGVIISVAGALLAWTMLAGEMFYLASRGERRTAPAVFGRMNKAGSPAPALWLTNGLIMVLLMVAYKVESGYNALIQLATSMALIPYLLTAGFSLKLAYQEKRKSNGLIFMAVMGTIYGGWLIYAAGLKYLLLSMILYAPGLLFFMKARGERGEKYFVNIGEKISAATVLVLCIVAIVMIGVGELTL